MGHKILKFWAYYEIAKFTWNQTDHLGNWSKEILNKETISRIVANDTLFFFGFQRQRTRQCISPHFSQICRLIIKLEMNKVLQWGVGVCCTV